MASVWHGRAPIARPSEFGDPSVVSQVARAEVRGLIG